MASITVHPRVCGEQTLHKWLSHKAICAVDKFTNIARPLAPAAQCDESWLSKSCFVVYLFDSGSAASGKNSTSVTPSNSVGTRRFLPAVSNWNPASLVVSRQAMTDRKSTRLNSSH